MAYNFSIVLVDGIIYVHIYVHYRLSSPIDSDKVKDEQLDGGNYTTDASATRAKQEVNGRN